MSARRPARSDVVGSLLRPAYLKDARQAAREGQLGDAELRAVEDRAVREAITLQEGAGIVPTKHFVAITRPPESEKVEQRADSPGSTHG